MTGAPANVGRMMWRSFVPWRKAESLELACTVLFCVALTLWLSLGDPQTKWVLIVLAGLIGWMFLLAIGDAKKLLLVSFVLALQINMNFFIIVDKGSSWVGASGAEGIAIPLIAIPAMLLLLQGQFKRGVPKLHLEKEVVISFSLMFLTAAMTALYAPSKRNVIYNLFEMGGFFGVLFVARNAIKSRQDVVLVLKVLMALLATQAIIYFIQDLLGFTFNVLGATAVRGEALGDVKRYGGTVSVNAKGFSSFITPLLLMGVSCYLTGSKQRSGHFIGIVCGMGAAALIMSFTRMSWVGFGLGCMWIIGIGLRRRRINLNRVVPFLAVMVLAIVLLLPRIIERLNADAASDLQERLNLMKMAWLVIQANPLWGVGSGAYPSVFRDYLTGDLMLGHWLFVVHNAYLLRWAETGIFGLLSLLLFLAVSLRAAYKNCRTEDPLLFSLAIGWVAGLISSLWEMFWDISLGVQTAFLFWFMLGVMLAMNQVLRMGQPSRRRQQAAGGSDFPPVQARDGQVGLEHR